MSLFHTFFIPYSIEKKYSIRPVGFLENHRPTCVEWTFQKPSTDHKE